MFVLRFSCLEFNVQLGFWGCQRFGNHCSCHLQGNYVMVGHFWKPYIGQAVGGELELMVLIGGAPPIACPT
jgi:hypothetical protein